MHPLQNIRMTNDLLPGIPWHAYRFECRCMRISRSHLENLDCDYFAFVPSLPNFDHLGDIFGIVSLPHDALKFVCIAATARQPRRSGDTSPPRSWIPVREPLGREYDQNWKERYRGVSPQQPHQCAFRPPRTLNPPEEQATLGAYCGYQRGLCTVSNGKKETTVKNTRVREGTG